MTYKKKYPQFTRNAEPSTLQECISKLLDIYKLRGKMNQTHVMDSWSRLLGKVVASRTEKLFMRNKTLYVKLNSAPLKHELSMGKSKLIVLLNKEFKEAVVEDIVFL